MVGKAIPKINWSYKAASLQYHWKISVNVVKLDVSLDIEVNLNNCHMLRSRLFSIDTEFKWVESLNKPAAERTK